MAGFPANVFVKSHQALLDIYSVLVDVGAGGLTTQDVIRRMDVIGQAVLQAQCARSLVSYERYLDIFCLRLREGGLKERLTLLDPDRFDAELSRDPSNPCVVIGAALSKLRCGNVKRGRHLLRRLATSRFSERSLAQQVLGALILHGGAR